MLFQVAYIALLLFPIIAGFFAGRDLHHLRGKSLLWLALLLGTACMSPELMNILAPKLAAATGFSQRLCLNFLIFITLYGAGIFLALSLPPPGTFGARSRE